MKSKQVRSILSDSTYPLSSQEQKEHAASTIMKYCKVRALAKILGLPLCQTKESLIRAADHKIFFDCSFVQPPSEELQKHYETELFLHQRVSGEPEGHESDSIDTLPGYEEPKSLSSIFNELWSMQKTKLGPEELYRCLSHFTRPNMIFHNFLRHSSSSGVLTPILYLPFTVPTIPLLSDHLLRTFAKYLGFFTQYEESSKYEILRQKFRDLFYLIEDHEDMHLVVPCQAYLKGCKELASEHCANYMCKTCCQSSGFKLPCLIHDEQFSFSRYKASLLQSAEKEWKMDKERTLRFRVRGKLRMKDLQGKLSKYEIEWANLKVLESPVVHRVQYVYVEFKSKADAAKAFGERKDILKKEEGCVECLYEGMEEFASRMDHFAPENVLVIYKPSTALKLSDNIPSKADRCAQLLSLLTIITGLDKEQVKIVPGINRVTGDPNNDQIFVILPNKSYVHQVFISQPFFKYLIADKWVHLNYYVTLKSDRTMCARCSLPLNPDCTLGLCDECCARQYDLKTYCSHSAKLRDLLASSKSLQSSPGTFCDVCGVPSPDKIPLCPLCRLYQPVHPLSFSPPTSLYNKSVSQMNIAEFLFGFKKRLMELDMTLRTQMMEGIYTWFYPIEGSAVARKMVEANKEFHMKHLEDTKKARKCRVADGGFMVEQGIDVKGEQYVDSYYNLSGSKPMQVGKEVPGKHKKGSQYTFTEKQWSPRVKSHSASENWHLFLLGFDVYNYTKSQLRTSIYEELNRKVGKISLDNIQFIDPHSLVNKIYIESNSWEKADEVMRKYGIVCVVKFNDIIDGVRLLSTDVTLRLPLCPEAERAHIFPSKFLVKYIEDYN